MFWLIELIFSLYSLFCLFCLFLLALPVSLLDIKLLDVILFLRFTRCLFTRVIVVVCFCVLLLLLDLSNQLKWILTQQFEGIKEVTRNPDSSLGLKLNKSLAWWDSCMERTEQICSFLLRSEYHCKS